MTRGRCGSLALHRMTLAFTAPRRFDRRTRSRSMKNDNRYVGLDVHAETIAVAVVETDGEVRFLGTIPNRAETVRRFVKRRGPGDPPRVCCRGGAAGGVLCWQWAGIGGDCRRVAATLVPGKAGGRVETGPPGGSK